MFINDVDDIDEDRSIVIQSDTEFTVDVGRTNNSKQVNDENDVKGKH